MSPGYENTCAFSLIRGRSVTCYSIGKRLALSLPLPNSSCQNRWRWLYVALYIALLILQPFHHFTYVTAHFQPFRRFTYATDHSPTLPSLYLRHRSFSNPSVASPTSQYILQPFFRFSYVTGSSLTSPGEPPMVYRHVCTYRTCIYRIAYKWSAYRACYGSLVKKMELIMVKKGEMGCNYCFRLCASRHRGLQMAGCP